MWSGKIALPALYAFTVGALLKHIWTARMERCGARTLPAPQV